MMVALFSGIVWLSRDTMAAGHIRFFLKSPGDAQFFAPLQAATELSLFSEFTIGGALIECSLKEAELAGNRLIPPRLNLAITHFANAAFGLVVPTTSACGGGGKC